MEEIELICFRLITAVGGAKSNYIEAIQRAKRKLYEESAELIKQGDEMMIEGHKLHANLLTRESSGEDVKMGLLLAHAEDQMMSTEVFKVMAEEMIELYKKVNEMED